MPEKKHKRTWNPDFIGSDDEYIKAYRRWYRQEKKCEIKETKRQYYLKNRAHTIAYNMVMAKKRKEKVMAGEIKPTAIIGIYGIMNKETGRWYIGQSVNVMLRLSNHIKSLRKGTHHSKTLQEDFNKIGITNFLMVVLKTCEVYELSDLENKAIAAYDAINNGYNTLLPVDELTGLGA